MNYRKYIPALTFEWLTPLYDPVMLFMRESTFKRTLVEQADIKNGYRVLDLGCGTATLTILIKKAYPGAEVTGLDGDPKILSIARAKVAQAGLDISLDTGMSFELPYPDRSFDRVFSSLFHHLTREDKARTFKEIFRVQSSQTGGRIARRRFREAS
ncbi:Ubiquinone/menaquinone biosynthesis C-methyltransferase UbiE [uncultured archaeon]|nr:Ubiquinone/menaquinone biosynthesis C-methyltransferase UbiE [uncultured archaeon]